MDFDEQVVAEAEELLIEELHMLGFQGMFIKLLKQTIIYQSSMQRIAIWCNF